MTIPYKLAREENLDLNLEFWDDWSDWRDSLRYNGDHSMTRSAFMCFARSGEVERYNKKLRKLNAIRKARKGY